MTDACGSLNDQHLVSETIGATIPGAGLLPSAIILCRLYRAAGDSWVGAIAAQLPALLEFDIHLLHDSLGSDLEYSKSY